MYTAQGEFLCKTNTIEHFKITPTYMCGNTPVASKDNCCNGIPVASKDNCCYGFNVASPNECNTCGKIKALFVNRGHGDKFKANRIKQCIPKGSWQGTCGYPIFDDDGITFKAGCFNVNGFPSPNTQNTSVNLTLCNSQSYSNMGGQLKCDN